MAFFGLTALGPQNSFQRGLKDSLLVDVFSDQEFEDAFRQVAVEDKLLGHGELEEVKPKESCRRTGSHLDSFRC